MTTVPLSPPFSSRRLIPTPASGGVEQVLHRGFVILLAPLVLPAGIAVTAPTPLPVSVRRLLRRGEPVGAPAWVTPAAGL